MMSNGSECRTYVCDTGITLNARRFLETAGEIFGDFAEDTDLTLEDLLTGTVGHVT